MSEGIVEMFPSPSDDVRIPGVGDLDAWTVREQFVGEGTASGERLGGGRGSVGGCLANGLGEL